MLKPRLLQSQICKILGMAKKIYKKTQGQVIKTNFTKISLICLFYRTPSSISKRMSSDFQKHIFYVNSKTFGLQICRKKRVNNNKFKIAPKQSESNI